MRLTPIAIVLFWLVMMGLLVQQESSTPASAGQTAPGNAIQSYWYGLFEPEGKKDGYANLESAPARREGQDGREIRLSVKVDRPEAPGALAQAFRLVGSIWVSANQPKAVGSFESSGGALATSAKLSADGPVMNVTLNLGGLAEMPPLAIPFDGYESLRGSALPRMPEMAGLKPGDERAFSFPNPLLGKEEDATVRFVKETRFTYAKVEVPAWETVVLAQGRELRAIVGQDGELYELELPMGLILRKLTPDEATAE